LNPAAYSTNDTSLNRFPLRFYLRLLITSRISLGKPQFTHQPCLRAFALRGHLTRDIHDPIENLEAVILERPMLDL
jgi:hypothetical protein